MLVKTIVDVVGTLFPIIFPKQEFKPKRAVGALVSVVVAIVAINTLGIDGAETAIGLAADVIELTEE